MPLDPDVVHPPGSSRPVRPQDPALENFAFIPTAPVERPGVVTPFGPDGQPLTPVIPSHPRDDVQRC